ncbi:MAG: HlyD family type I secretion periplasmic adaptor subunit [Nitrospirae bacterium]|nr:HlyD family type I secretion periplasmic adaptor subunit [Nitrospirota bacterium]
MVKWFKDFFKTDNLEYEFLPPVLEIEETPHSPLSRALIWIILLIVVLAFLWSYLGHVDEVAMAQGRVIPDGKIKVIQPIETGVIRAIHVKEGERVKEGQLLIELDPTIKEADVESAAKTLSIHKSDKERLLEELNGKNTGYRQEAIGNKDEAKGDNLSPIAHSLSPKTEILQLQKQLKNARQSEYKAREDALKLVIAQKENALHAAGALLTKLEKTYTIIKEQEAAYKTLYEQGILAKMELLDKQKELYSTEQDLEAQKKVIEQGRDGLEEAKKNLDALKMEREKGILGEIVEREKSIAAMEGETVKARKRYEFERLTSPVDGAVHGLSTYTIGGIVTPAQPIVTIVPEGTPLIIEATVLNKDIGFVKVGQEAEVKFDTFPFQKYGTIKGKVLSVSPDAFDDEKLGPVYKMKVSLEKLSMIVDGRDASVSPGMTVIAEIKTGKRRIIEFFLSPIVKYSNESLTLR